VRVGNPGLITLRVPKQVQEPKRFYEHPDEWPFQKDEENASQEARRPSYLLLAREKVEGFLRPDDQCHAGYEEDLCGGGWMLMLVRDALSRAAGTHVAEREERPIKEEHDTQEHEEATSRREGHTDLCRGGMSCA